MEYYDTIAPGYDELHKGEQLKKYRFIEKYLHIEKGDSLLDVGCGTGFSSEIFRCGITGIDSSKDMLDEAKNSLRKAALVQGRAEHLPFKNEAFDIIICVSAFHNFEEPGRALEEMNRVGKGKGVITIMRKARKAEELRTLVEKVFNIEKIVDEDKDIILFFGIA